jgi:hypothetical protein
MAFFKANIQEKKEQIPPFFLLGVCLIAKDLFLRLFNSSRFASSISVKTVTWCKSEILSINSSL